MHYLDKKKAKTRLAAALERRGGWRLWGFHEDQSDSMTDYYCPAYWEGIATHASGAVLVVDVDARHTWMLDKGGKAPPAHTRERAGDCGACAATGLQPDGWTLDQARQDPRGFDKATAEPGVTNLFPTIVSPALFNAEGAELCRKCHGSGGFFVSTVVEGPEDQRWPKFQPNPGRCSWHVERDGVILGRGTGVFSIEEGDSENAKRERADKLAEHIEDALRPRTTTNGNGAGAQVTASAEGVTVRPGLYPDSSEIVFPEKPGPEVIETLKLAGYRWHRVKRCWYGKTANLPGGLAQ